MKEEGFIPDDITNILILKLCYRNSKCRIRKSNFQSNFKNGSNVNNLKLQNSLINFYGKTNQLENAISIFNTIRKKD